MITRQEDTLYREYFDIEWQLYSKLYTLIEAKWDANILKKDIELLMKSYTLIRDEIEELEEKSKEEKK